MGPEGLVEPVSSTTEVQVQTQFEEDSYPEESDIIAIYEKQPEEETDQESESARFDSPIKSQSFIEEASPESQHSSAEAVVQVVSQILTSENTEEISSMLKPLESIYD